MSEQAKLYKDADSRLKKYFRQVSHPIFSYERTYCFRCGAPSGFASKDSSEYVSPAHVVVTCDDCDNEIIEKYGGLDGFPLKPVPTDLLDAFGIVPEHKGE